MSKAYCLLETPQLDMMQDTNRPFMYGMVDSPDLTAIEKYTQWANRDNDPGLVVCLEAYLHGDLCPTLLLVLDESSLLDATTHCLLKQYMTNRIRAKPSLVEQIGVTRRTTNYRSSQPRQVKTRQNRKKKIQKKKGGRNQGISQSWEPHICESCGKEGLTSIGETQPRLYQPHLLLLKTIVTPGVSRFHQFTLQRVATLWNTSIDSKIVDLRCGIRIARSWIKSSYN
jgi:hypothetical protein